MCTLYRKVSYFRKSRRDKYFKMELTFNSIQVGEYEQVSEFVLNMYVHHLKRFYTDKGHEDFKEFSSAASFEKRHKEGGKLFLIKEGEDLVGLLEFDKEQLHNFFIVEQYRGRGYGRMSINWLKNYFKEQNMGASLEVQSPPSSYTAFEKMGFTPVGEESESGDKVSKTMKLTV